MIRILDASRASTPRSIARRWPHKASWSTTQKAHYPKTRGFVVALIRTVEERAPESDNTATNDLFLRAIHCTSQK